MFNYLNHRIVITEVLVIILSFLLLQSNHVLAATPPSDSIPDLIWRNISTGQNAVWYMNANGTMNSSNFITSQPDLNSRIISTIDFDNDGRSELVWSSFEPSLIWFLDANGNSKSTLSLRTGGIPAIGNINDDKIPDLIYNGLVIFLNADGSINSYKSTIGVGGLWRIFGTTDFNNDGRSELVWNESSSGNYAVWFFDNNGNLVSSRVVLVGDENWEIKAIGRINSDNIPDLVWRNKKDGRNAIWFMKADGTLDSSVYTTQVNDPNWKIVSTADFDKDGRDELIWNNIATGEAAIWFLKTDGTLSNSKLMSTGDSNWRIQGVGQINT